MGFARERRSAEEYWLPTASAGSGRARRLSLTCGLAGLLVTAAVACATHPVARAYDGTYYDWCVQAVGDKAYCCTQAGGSWSNGSCA